MIDDLGRELEILKQMLGMAYGVREGIKRWSAYVQGYDWWVGYADDIIAEIEYLIDRIESPPKAEKEEE